MAKPRLIKNIAEVDLNKDVYAVYEDMRALNMLARLGWSDAVFATRAQDITFIDTNPDLFETASNGAGLDTAPIPAATPSHQNDLAGILEDRCATLSTAKRIDLVQHLVGPVLRDFGKNNATFSKPVITLLAHITNATLFGLLENPDQLAAVKHEGNWTDAIDEAIRWCSPLQYNSFVAKSDLKIRTTEIPQGTIVNSVHASANRDPNIWEFGHLFNAYRPANPNKLWTDGVGHIRPLINDLVGVVLLPKIFDTFPNIKLADNTGPTWSGLCLRGATSLSATLR